MKFYEDPTPLDRNKKYFLTKYVSISHDRLEKCHLTYYLHFICLIYAFIYYTVSQDKNLIMPTN